MRAPGLSQRWTCNETSVGNTGQPYGKDEWKERERKKGGWWRTDGWTDGRTDGQKRERREREKESLPSNWAASTPLVQNSFGKKKKENLSPALLTRHTHIHDDATSSFPSLLSVVDPISPHTHTHTAKRSECERENRNHAAFFIEKYTRYNGGR